MSETNQMLFRRATEAESERDAAIARAEALVTAVRASGPWPQTETKLTDDGWYEECLQCEANSVTPDGDIDHAGDCPGVRIAALLDATGTERDGE